MEKVQANGNFLELNGASQRRFKFDRNVPAKLNFLNCFGAVALPR